MKKRIKNISFFLREDNKAAVGWKIKIITWLKKEYPGISIDSPKPDLVIILGGDGAIIEAVSEFKGHPIFFGLNLGHVGFLASVRKPDDFISSLNYFLKGKGRIIERMTLSAEVVRKGKKIYATSALNEIVIKNPLGMVEIEVDIEEHPVQFIRGTGVLISTATGSTAHNLSAHGPIIAPDMKCIILTEMLDHAIPTPSIVVNEETNVFLKINNFRKRGLLAISKTGEPFDVLLVADGEKIFSLDGNDKIRISRQTYSVKFVEIEKHYFFKSLQEKFGFK
jgi:NAD+ kinase